MKTIKRHRVGENYTIILGEVPLENNIINSPSRIYDNNIIMKRIVCYIILHLYYNIIFYFIFYL